MEDTIVVVKALFIIIFGAIMVQAIGGEFAQEAMKAFDTLIWGVIVISALGGIIYVFGLFNRFTNR